MLISIGMINDSGDLLYAVNADMDLAAVYAHPWLRTNVYPHLPRTTARCRCLAGHLDLADPAVMSRPQIARMVADFITYRPSPRLWGWYSDYDHVVLAQLFGTMAQLLAGIPQRTNDLQQEIDRMGNPPLPSQEGPAHHALADAMHIQRLRRLLGPMPPARAAEA